MHTNSQRLFGFMMICFLAPTTVAGDFSQVSMHTKISRKTMLIAGASLLLGVGFCLWKYLNQTTDAPSRLLPRDTSTDALGIEGQIRKVVVPVGVLYLKHGSTQSLQVNSESSSEEVVRLHAGTLTLLQRASCTLTLSKMPNVVQASGNGTIKIDEVTPDISEISASDTSNITIDRLEPSTLLLQRTEASSISTLTPPPTGDVWNSHPPYTWTLVMRQGKTECRGPGNISLQKSNKDKTVLEITSSPDAYNSVSV